MANVSIKLLLTLFISSVLYIIFGKLSIHYITMPEGIAIVWLPNAIILATFLLREKSEWIWYIIAFLISEIIADIDSFTFIQSIQFAILNITEGLISALLIQKFNKNNTNFQNVKYVVLFIVFALTLVPMITAFFGAIIYKSQIEEEINFFHFWRIWFFGDSLGLLLLTPLIVIVSQKKYSLKNLLTIKIESFLMIIFIMFLSLVVFGMEFDLTILPLTPMIFFIIFMWVTYREKLLFSLFLGLLVVFISIYFTVKSQGAFSIYNTTINTLYLQEFIATLMVLILFFGVLLKEIKDKNILLLKSNNKLKRLSEELEERVSDKTKSLKEANKKLELLTILDPLTQIFNRRYFESNIKNEIEKANRYNYDLSFVIIDIDYFKNINDSYGHQIGDEVLIKLSKVIKNNIRKSDVFSRIGGEEFGLLLPQTNREKAISLCEKVKDIVSNTKFPQLNKDLNITISIGISVLDSENKTYNQIFKLADDNLYKAKESGRNKIIG